MPNTTPIQPRSWRTPHLDDRWRQHARSVFRWNFLFSSIYCLVSLSLFACFLRIFRLSMYCRLDRDCLGVASFGREVVGRGKGGGGVLEPRPRAARSESLRKANQRRCPNQLQFGAGVPRQSHIFHEQKLAKKKEKNQPEQMRVIRIRVEVL